MSFYSVVTLRLTGVNNTYLNNSSTYEIGDNFRILMGISDQFSLGSFLVSPSLGGRYRKAEYDKFNRKNVPATGGEWVFLIPAFGISITPNMKFEISGDLPVYANPNGTQLSPTYRFNLGLYFAIGGNRPIGNIVE